jgi:hypothetical protein
MAAPPAVPARATKAPARRLDPAKNLPAGPGSSTHQVSEEEPSLSAPANARQPARRAGGVGKSRSAYPAPVEELIPRAQQLAERLGELPSRNRLKAELRIGAPKATAVLAALERAGFDPTGRPGTARLHVVPAGLEPEGDESETDPQVPSTDAADQHPTADNTDTAPVPSTAPANVPTTTPGVASPHASHDADPGTTPAPVTAADRVVDRVRAVRASPVLLLAAPAFVAIWSGWVGLGSLTGFGVVHPLPGIWDSAQLDTAITLPVGVETYAAYALRVWLSGHVPARARQFAKRSAIGSLALGALGQVAYHLMAAAGVTAAPWWITTLVACLPVAVLGMGAALAHLIRTDDTTTDGAERGEAVR